MSKLIDIRPEHLKIVEDILKKHLSVNATVWVFGSRAKNSARKFSDLDLAVDAGRPLSNQVMTELAFDFEESDLPYKVDVIDWHKIKENFKNLIE
jgi:predicted nucleotidyltransferase